MTAPSWAASHPSYEQRGPDPTTELQVPQARLANAAVTTGYVNLEIDAADGISFFTYQASSNPQSGEPSGRSGGQTTQHPNSAPPTPRSNCREHEAGDRYNGDHGSAIEWSHGFDLGAALNAKGVGGKISFNSTAHTGYDTNAVMVYRFHHKGYLCGTNGTEATAAIIAQRANLP
jgi:hypothetical protein